ncbi:MAG TPA: hypothetical protein VK599_22605 [Streptosporangiaceae bacterium]|nr:hypothetical protein [Streptosporangiaceae bacterium]
MSEVTEARLAKASRAYSRMKPQFEAVRHELADAIVAERREGTLIEDITEKVPYRQSQVNRILEAAGLTEKRKPATAPPVAAP